MAMLSQIFSHKIQGKKIKKFKGINERCGFDSMMWEQIHVCQKKNPYFFAVRG